MAIFAGYLASYLRRVRKQAPPEVIRFCRREQIRRLRAAFKIGKPAQVLSPLGVRKGPFLSPLESPPAVMWEGSPAV